MKAVQFKSFGLPTTVADCVDLPEPGKPGAGEATVEVLATPINPSDVMTLLGMYGTLPKLPATPGNEGIGRVLEVGSGVEHLRPGDLALLPVGAGAWTTKILAPAAKLVPMPPDADPQQLAMLTINPPTALLLLRDVVELKEGDWVVQNAANSAVGTYLIKLAKLRGLKTANIVRRDSLIEPLKKLGADVVIVDGHELGKRVSQATGGAKIRLGIDCIGGESTMRLAGALTHGGTVCNYGAMAGEPCKIGPQDLIFRNITLRGFWLAHWFARATQMDQMTVFGQLIGLVADGTLKAEIEATYPLDKIKDALAHAMQPERSGKILLTPNK
ncbi:MAG TPA: zinc-dependent alcohol dehydrogenase family protein [Pirellulales bacterium]|jgi:NADPH:quinone reductase-like Zn-dependent oxidoreductase